MVGGDDAANIILLALWSEVGMKLDHEILGRDSVSTVDLNFVVALCEGRATAENAGDRYQ
jgi:hypothetical protein